MRSFFVILLTLVLATPMSGCAFLTEQINSIETMDEDQFASIELQVYTYAKVGGKQLRGKLSEQSAAYIDALLGALISQSNAERAENLAKLLNSPEYKNTIAFAISAALDFIEAQLGKPLDLSSTGLTLRQHRLVRAMLEGVRDGLFETT